MILDAQHLSFSYTPERPVLQDASFSANRGEILLVVGRNGAGKSTLLKLLNGILRPTGGKIIIGGNDSKEISTSTLASTVCVTFQNPSDQLFASSVKKEVQFGPHNLRRPEPDRLATDALALLGLTELQSAHPYDLNAAQRKLVTIASAIATDAPILAFDEPTAYLSQSERGILTNALSQLVRDGRTLLIVSHDLSFFLPLVDRVMVLEDGAFLFQGTVSEFWNARDRLRSCGIRFPLAWRLKPHVGLDPLPQTNR